MDTIPGVADDTACFLLRWKHFPSKVMNRLCGKRLAKCLLGRWRNIGNQDIPEIPRSLGSAGVVITFHVPAFRSGISGGIWG